MNRKGCRTLNTPTTAPLDKRIVLMTGDGRGKTTSALGLALRALGHGQRVCLVQFLKQGHRTGELQALNALPGIEIQVRGRGFVRNADSHALVPHRKAAADGLALAAERLADPAFGMVILDEICGAVSLGLLHVESVLNAIDNAHPQAIIVLTGRQAPPELEARADTVSRIACVKHAYTQGRQAQPGVEW